MNSSAEMPYEEAFRQVLAHRTMLKAYVQAIVRDPFLAEDAFSEVTLEIARSWNRFDRSRPFESWARGVARRVALTSIRKQGRQPVTLDDSVLESIGTELDAFGNEIELGLRKEALETCLGILNEATASWFGFVISKIAATRKSRACWDEAWGPSTSRSRAFTRPCTTACAASFASHESGHSPWFG